MILLNITATTYISLLIAILQAYYIHFYTVILFDVCLYVSYHVLHRGNQTVRVQIFIKSSQVGGAFSAN